MAISITYLNKIMDVVKPIDTATLINAASVGDHKPTPINNYGTQPLTWGLSNAGKIESDNLTFLDIPVGSTPNTLVIKRNKSHEATQAALTVTSYKTNFYDVLTKSVVSDNEVIECGSYGAGYNFVLFSADASMWNSGVNKENFILPTGTGISDVYTAMRDSNGGAWNTDPSAGYVLIIKAQLQYSTEYYFAKHKGLLFEAGGNKFKVNTTGLTHGISYNLIDHQSEPLIFNNKGSIITKIKRSVEEL